MIQRVCLKLCDCFIDTGIITSEMKDLYCYGMHQGVVLFFNLLTALFIGVLLDSVMEVILYLTAYIPLRIYAGGYHAETPGRCYIFSVILITAILLAIRFFAISDVVCCIGMILSFAVIFIIAPMEDKNKPFTTKEQIFFKKQIRYLLFIETIFFIIACFISCTTLSTYIFAAFITMAFMLILGHIKNKYRKN